VSRSGLEAAVPVLPTASPGPESEDDLLDAAFELAFFIHQDRSIALAICRDAMQKLEVAASAQIKRLYYRPRKRTGEGPLRQGRSRASWGDRHLLQRLTYFESEAWERQGEARDPESLTEDDLLLRFLKHLCQITMKRNSFYASIALGRIVHAYSTADTMGLYDAIAPEGCERKQSDYFRSRKAQLLDEVRARFGELLSIVRGPHQEDRIETREATAQKAAWARECLRVLTPWATPCWGKEEETSSGKRRRNRFAREQDEDSQEARRFHALFHPPCFTGLTRLLRLADPAGRLAIPRFHVGGRPPAQGGGGRDDRSARLNPEERAEIQRQLSEESRRRREFPTRFLRVLVDGRERARIDPRASGVARLSLEDSAEMIEVRATVPDGEILLAVHALAGAPEGEETGPEVFSIVLESGQSLSFRVDGTTGLAGERVLELDYRETGPLRAALLGARRAAYRAGNAARFAAGWAQQPITLLLLLGAIGLALQSGRTPSDRSSVRPRFATTAPLRSALSAEIPRPAPPLSAPSVDRSVPSTAALALPARSDSPLTTAIAHVRSRRGSPPEGSLVRNPPRETVPRSKSPAPIFSAARTPLLEGERIAASRSDLGDLVKGVNAKTALEAVRKSFVDGLGNETIRSSERGGGLPDAASISFARVSTEERSGPTRRDPRVAAFWADVSARSLASETTDGLESRLLPSKPADPSPRVSVLRRIGAPGLPVSAYCRQGELACSVARISPARNTGQTRAD
jgi:hypothetical protein